MPGKPKAKKKTLPKNFEQMLGDGTELAVLQAVFETCEVDARGGYSKETALLMAARRDDLARWLVANGADTRAVDSYGNTSLHLRARSRRSDIGVLIELGCDVNAKNALGETPLHAAADAKNANAVEQLLAAGADIAATNRERLTPLEFGLCGCSNSQIESMVEVARLLLAAGAPRTPDMSGFVKRIGETFEFHRSGFNPDMVEATSAAMFELCRMFEVDPPPRRQMHDGNSLIHVTSQRWHEQHKELWDLLVPSKGAAATMQGEVVRISGRIAHELQGNGGGNWDADFRKMSKTFFELVRSGAPLPRTDLQDVERIVDDLIGRAEGDTRRLAELAVAWVLLNPEPLPLGNVSYSR